MKSLINSWNSFLAESSKDPESHKNTILTKNSEKENIYNIYFSGLSRKVPDTQSPKYLIKKYKNILEQWAYNNGNLILLSMREINFETNLEIAKIIGFSAGARAALRFSVKKPSAELVLLDPWMPAESVSMGRSPDKFYGPSCSLTTNHKNGLKVHVPRLKKLGLWSGQCEEKKHISYFLDYFRGHFI